jgi:hypothetical protein
MDEATRPHDRIVSECLFGEESVFLSEFVPMTND